MSDVAFTAIQDFLNANFTAAPLNFENELFPLPDPPTPWVDVEIYSSTYDQAFGTGTPAHDNWREEGAVICHVMVPVNSGTLQGRQIASQLAGLFQGLRIEPDIRFGALSIGSGMAQLPLGNWWPITLTAAWARDQTI